MRSIVSNFAKPDEIVINVQTLFHLFTFILSLSCHVDSKLLACQPRESPGAKETELHYT
jgi:hypothetical protein